MHKIIIFFFLHGMVGLSLHAKEPLIALLENIISNDTQKFRVGNFNFYCQPFGVHTLEELYTNSKPDSTCQEVIKQMYKKKPLVKYYSENLLKIEQGYHIEFREQRCVLYAKGEITLSELLLKNGLAMLKPKFKDKEFSHVFQKAQEYAQTNKLGMWNENIDTKCISAVKKD